jgi:uncharacterized protein YdaU (DUF1376 family)
MSFPYYKRFPRDFLEATIGFSLELKGAYTIVLDLIYMRGGRLPDDPQYIAGQLGCSVRKWNSLRAKLVSLGKLNVENGLISNFRADVLLEETRSFREKQAENRSHPNKNSGLQSPKADHLEPDTEEEVRETIAKAIVAPQPPDPPESKSTGRVRGAARATQLPPNWTPNITNLAYASQHGLSREEINHEADQFRNHAAANGKRFKDWDAGFRTWLGNTVKWRGERAAGQAARAKPGGQSRGGGMVAAGLRAISEARGFGEQVPERGRDMGAGYDLDGDALRIAGS